MAEIRDIIKDIVRDTIESSFGVPCKVVAGSYSASLETIDAEPISGDAVYKGVRLQAEKSAGVLMIPTDGSVVMVHEILDGAAYVSMFGAIDTIAFRGGANGGLINVADMVTQMNQIENAYNLHVHVALSTPTVSLVVPTVAADVEDTTITH